MTMVRAVAVMTMVRVVAIIVGVAIVAVLYRFDVPWYIHWPLGIAGYLVVRYIGWAIAERGRFLREENEVIKMIEKEKREQGGQKSN